MKILITRPEPDASQLALLLQQADFTTTVWPLLELVIPAQAGIQPTGNEELIFVSKTAVKAYRGMPTARPCFAIGKSTAAELQQAGFSQVLYPPTAEGSEALLALAELQNLKGRCFTLICGTESRPLLKQTLRERGAKVSTLITYKTRFCVAPIPTLQADYDFIITTSSQALRYLASLADTHNRELFQIPLSVLAGTMLNSARALGFQKPEIVDSFQNQKLYEFLRHYAARADSRQ